MILKGFFDLPAELMTALGTVLGFAMLGDLTASQQNTLGNFLMLIGQILETNAAQIQLFQAQAQTKHMAEVRCAIQELQAEVCRLKGQLAASPPPEGDDKN